ncbi:hypothetical protein B0T16DRAFT_207398 [Cercophora newfieldiana]|uniref:Uncharacterized protein n=1 Tax=Cercophora newfieldiana TaxID=92897 RepID=A0AA40CKR8_9PEZI|nr:hypothetical protein B0T16DRAFT_207398 [Cercophora newfieldiana]
MHRKASSTHICHLPSAAPSNAQNTAPTGTSSPARLPDHPSSPTKIAPTTSGYPTVPAASPKRPFLRSIPSPFAFFPSPRLHPPIHHHATIAQPSPALPCAEPTGRLHPSGEMQSNPI